VPPVRTYTTAVVSEDGSLQAELLSIPQFFELGEQPEGLMWLGEEFGIQLGASVSEESLSSMLGQIAYESSAGQRAGPNAVSQVVQALVDEPVVVVEESPAVGTTLTALVSQAGPAYILVAQGRPFLALAAEAGLVVVWFIAGPIQGAREGLREGTKVVVQEAFERALRERFKLRRKRRK
jgi:hypothetical protein